MAPFVRTRQSNELNLREVSSLDEFSVFSSDGEEIGHVQDALFDDGEWAIRYLEINAGDRLPGRKILISPESIEIPDWEIDRLNVSMKGEELGTSPSLALDEPVSRSYLIELYRKFGWLPYWAVEEYYDEREGPAKISTGPGSEEEKEQDPHLYSMKEMNEYRVEAADGDIGFVDELIMDEEDWIVYYVVVAIEAEIPEEESSKSVLVAPDWIQELNRDTMTTHIDVGREMLMAAPEYDPSVPVTRDYEYAVFDHYGRPHYWIGEGDSGPE